MSKQLFFAGLLCLLWVMLIQERALSAFVPSGQEESQVLDFRYAPIMEQMCIGLPDDPYKTVVGCDTGKRHAGMYYDYCGNSHMMGFQTRILASSKTAGAFTWSPPTLRLWGPRVPIVTLEQAADGLTFTQQAWADAPESTDVEQWSRKRVDYLWLTLQNQTGRRQEGGFALQVDTHRALTLNDDKTRLIENGDPDRVFCVFSDACEAIEYKKALGIYIDPLPTIERDWARPTSEFSSLFHHVMIGWNRPLEFQYPAAPDKVYQIAFGLVEGYYAEAGMRPLEIHVEGRNVKTVDLAKEYGKNVPAVFTFSAKDRNGNGVIEFGVHPAAGAKDTNTIVSGLWLFDGDAAPAAQTLLTGAANDHALATIHADNTAQGRTRSLTIQFKQQTLNAGQESQLLVKLPQGPRTSAALTEEEPQVSQKQALAYWQNVSLPYDRIQVPDKNMQALLDSCIRNIYQAREIKNGLPAFQVGPTCYRGLWVVDGAFILEAASYLGRMEEARAGIQYLLGFQRPDGAFMLIDGHWKEVGIVLWALSRHAFLSGDKEWLESVWPKVEKGVAFIESMRNMPPADAPNARLVPDGFSDGGLAGSYPEFTNIYWTLAGYKSIIEAAAWLGKDRQAHQWQKQYDDFYAAFAKAAKRDMKVDRFGNKYIPTRMVDDQNVGAQKAQWAFLHAVFPGRLFAAEDPLLVGTMAMLKTHERQGLVQDTGWIKGGLWNYFGSFYGHAWLWLGQGSKAADTLYAFANHASPLLVWREEQKPVGESEDYCGDMPHNWGSAEFIRLIRHLLVLERGRQLHLLEGLPSAWTQPGNRTQLSEMPTSFGPVSILLQVAEDGKSAKLTIEPPQRDRPEKIVLHLGRFGAVAGLPAGYELADGTVSIPTNQTVTLTLH